MKDITHANRVSQRNDTLPWMGYLKLRGSLRVSVIFECTELETNDCNYSA
jgi:hypothetical protein